MIRRPQPELWKIYYAEVQHPRTLPFWRSVVEYNTIKEIIENLKNVRPHAIKIVVAHYVLTNQVTEKP